jgi:hypothetical protein
MIKWLKDLFGLTSLENEIEILKGNLEIEKRNAKYLENRLSVLKKDNVLAIKEKEQMIEELNSMIKSFTVDLPKSKSIKYIDRVLDDINRSMYKKRVKVKKIVAAEELPSPKVDFSAFNAIDIDRFRVSLGDDYEVKLGNHTNSMEPLIDKGHRLLIRNTVNVHKLMVGDIILFDRILDNQPFVLHRIVEIGKDKQGWYCITRGDNLVFNDQLNGKFTRAEHIHGKLVGIFY